MTPAIRSLLLISISLVSGADLSASFAQNATTTPQRGQLLENPPPKLGSYSVSDLLSKLSDGRLGQKLLKLTFSPACSVDVYQLKYETVGGRGEATTASGALMIPAGSDSKCQGPRPIVLYAHGKKNLKSFNIADLSGENNYEGLLLAVVLAADGYIVVAPNYAGYDASTLGYHPYLNADQQSSDMIDALTAAHTAFAATNSADNHKLFVTGYSQGGYVAMATHRALQAAGVPVTASAPMSGPYALSAFGDAVFMGLVSAGATEQFAMLASSYQHAYGNLYSSPTDVFETKYASVDSLLPSTTGVDTLLAQGQIPESALFNSTPPAPELASMTPATTPEDLAPQFALGFGTDNLVTNSYRLNYLQDALSAPDGGFPNTASGLPPASPANTFRQALKNNDLRNWSPTAPVLLCAGNEDPVVFFLNTQLMQGYWAVNAPNSAVTILDVDSSPSRGDPYKRLKKRFAATKDLITFAAVVGGATDGGRSAVLQDYHGILVPTFCVQAARSFFDTY
jgi:alpha/beta superfamily hydrolase